MHILALKPESLENQKINILMLLFPVKQATTFFLWWLFNNFSINLLVNPSNSATEHLTSFNFDLKSSISKQTSIKIFAFKSYWRTLTQWNTKNQHTLFPFNLESESIRPLDKLYFSKALLFQQKQPLLLSFLHPITKAPYSFLFVFFSVIKSWFSVEMYLNKLYLQY